MTAHDIINGLTEYLEHPTYMIDPNLLVGAIKKLGEVAEARETLLRLRHEVGYIRKKDIEDAFAGIVEDEK